MDFVSGWQPVATAAATLALLITGLAFALGCIFDLRALRAWGKLEFFQAVVSAVLVGVLLSASVGIASFAQDVAGGQEPIAFAQSHLAEVNERIVAASGTLTMFALVLSAVHHLEVGADLAVVKISTKPLAGLKSVLDEAEFILKALSMVKLTNAILQVLFLFISATMMYYFLPVGVILRSFPLTRPVGAFLMALAIGLYFVLPLTFVFNAAAMAQTHAQMDARVEALQDFNSKYDVSAINPLDPAAVSNLVFNWMKDAIWAAAISAIAPLAKLVADLTIQTTFFPLFNFGVVFLFTRSLYRILASEVVLWN